MNYISKIFIPVLWCLILLTSCQTDNYKMSDKIEQRTVFPQYQVQYNAQTRHFEATVYFTVDNPAGLSVKLSDRSSITFNKMHLNLERDDSTKRYFYRLAMDTLPKLLQFCYINDVGAVFENDLIMRKLEITNGNSITISKSLGAALSYSGQPIATNKDNEETVSCQLSQQGKETIYFTIDIMDNHQISIKDYMLFEVPAGKYECRFLRDMSSSNIKAMDRGGIITSSYITKPYTLIITD
ncbi:MAG: hypothetical protein LBK03_02860 [Bacteroidales bacterium]|jgi:hypothetical protein|nr:hypothetical protein [Bacteroidales bacterium]